MNVSTGPQAIAGITAIVPSLGHSPWQSEMLAALRSELVGFDAELVWVHQGPALAPDLGGPRERLVRLARAVGFAAAVNQGFAAADPRNSVLAIVNDDLIVEPGWLSALVGELERRPHAAAVQGVQLELERPLRVEGCGVGWNRFWQAVQVGAGGEPPAADAPPFEVFGVSATAALYRREAIAAGFFEERLGSYYEDVELAVRLREAEWESWCVPAARARHAGQATAGRAPFGRWRSIYRNRLLVLRRLLGDEFAAALPRAAARDLRDFARACLRLDAARALGVVAGWSAAIPNLPEFAPPSGSATRSALAAAERFRIGSPA